MQSKILQNDLGWKDASRETPSSEKRVVARLYHEKSDQEDVKVATYQENQWSVSPPFPLFDYSPLSKKASLKDGVTVTHWRYPDTEELKFWDERFQPIGKYEHLSIEVDSSHAEDVYRALIWGASMIYNFADEEHKHLADILSDLQACMDAKEES